MTTRPESEDTMGQDYVDPIELAREQWIEVGWGEPARSMAVVTSIMRANQIFLSQLDLELRDFDITFARFEVLGLLSFSRRGRLPLGRLSERLQVSPASITKSVTKLEAQGLLKRTQDSADGRTFWAEITPEGLTRVNAATEHLNSTVLAEIRLDHDDQDLLVDILTRLRRRNGDFLPVHRTHTPS